METGALFSSGVCDAHENGAKLMGDGLDLAFFDHNAGR